MITVVISDSAHGGQLPARGRQGMFMKVVLAFDATLVVHSDAEVDMAYSLAQLNIETFLLLICKALRPHQVLENRELGARGDPIKRSGSSSSMAFSTSR